MSEQTATQREAALAIKLLDASPDGLVLVDEAGTIVVANRTAARMFGYSDGALVGRFVDDLVPAEQRSVHSVHRKAYERDPKRRPAGVDRQLVALHRSGIVFPVEISLSPIAIGEETQTVATIRDLTERQQVIDRQVLLEEREQIARDVYDLVIQRLFAIGMSLQSVTSLIEPAAARERVEAATEDLDETVRAVRNAIFRVG